MVSWSADEEETDAVDVEIDFDLDLDDLDAPSNGANATVNVEEVKTTEGTADRDASEPTSLSDEIDEPLEGFDIPEISIDYSDDSDDSDLDDSDDSDDSDLDDSDDSDDSDSDDSDDSRETDDADDTSEASYEEQVERAIHEEVNDVRAEHGLEPLEFDEELASIARGHSQDMAENGFFDHDTPRGESVGDRYDDAGVACSAWGENILYNYHSDKSPEVVAEYSVNQWMNSEGHRENILSGRWDTQGIGVEIADDGRLYATQNFGTNCN